MIDFAALERLLTSNAPVDAERKYAPCLYADTQERAQRHLRACVAHLRRLRPQLTLTEALAMERAKIGYFAGALPHPERQRIEALYNCVHPFAGAAVDDTYRRRNIQLGSEFGAMVRAWDTQPPDSRSFGMHRQPTWDAHSYGNLPG